MVSNRYEEWKVYADEMDAIRKGTKWRDTPESELYDWKRIETMLNEIRRLNDAHDIEGMALFVLSKYNSVYDNLFDRSHVLHALPTSSKHRGHWQSFAFLTLCGRNQADH